MHKLLKTMNYEQHKLLKTMEMSEVWPDTYDDW